MDEKRIKKLRAFYKTDRALERVLRWFSYLAAVCVVLMAAIATLNVIAQKIFHSNIGSANDYVTYLFVMVIYTALPHVQMETDLTCVDILSAKFGRVAQLIVSVLGDLVGVVTLGYIGYAMYINVFLKYLSSKKVATVGATGTFVLWPFALLITVSMFLTVLTFLWNNVRRCMYGGSKFISPELCRQLGVKPPKRFGPPSMDEQKGGNA